MCARYTIQATAGTIADVFAVTVPDGMHPLYNIAPTDPVPGVVQGKDGSRLMWEFRWGLIPFWAKDPKIGVRMINARAETIATKPAFKDSFKHRRMLVVADGFYEWRTEDGVKQPYHIRRIDRLPFAMAGLYAKWKPPGTDSPLVSCTIVTTEPNALTSQIHDRMPVILPPETWDAWLDRERDDASELLATASPEAWEAVPVHRRIGNVRCEGPECFEEIGPPLTA
ncbi:MAG: SOS response-associated peptidase [Deltaproteobacteria bacterium]|nr:MAG: SOS response-associated peptidase [Deltaproteobacteria bacterium]